MPVFIEAHLRSRRVARVVYGTVIGLALVVALQGHPPRAVAMVGWLLGTAVTVGLAEVYSDFIGIETRQRHHVARSQLADPIRDAYAVAFGIAFPAVFFVLAAMGVVSTERAFSLAEWTGLGLIGFYGFWAARFAGDGRGRALAYGAAIALVGAVLISLKALLH